MNLPGPSWRFVSVALSRSSSRLSFLMISHGPAEVCHDNNWSSSYDERK